MRENHFRTSRRDREEQVCPSEVTITSVGQAAMVASG